MWTLLDSRVLDVNAKEAGVNMKELMENAGRAVADFVRTLNPTNVLVACGSGNNGGDGYVAAYNLISSGVKCDVIPVTPPSSELCVEKYNLFIDKGGMVLKECKIEDYDVVIDALLGVGIMNTPREPFYSFIERMNSSGSTIVSVDIPSGFLTGKSVKPKFTVTMQFIKEGMNEENCGKIIVADVGFPKEVVEMIGPGDLLAMPENARESHKGDNGVVVSVVGSSLFFGAPVYVAKSALRTGPDLIFIFAPASIHGHIASNVQDIILRRSGEEYIEFNYDMMKIIKERADSVAIGPGISKEPSALEEASKIIDFSLDLKKKIVVDADALECINHVDDFGGNAVLTPHRGEFRAAFNVEPTEDNARKVAGRLNAVILLKGEVDIITNGNVLKKNVSYHHQSMTRGGTGDLVTGAVAGLMARHLDPLHSSFLASYIIGSAGLLAFSDKKYSYYTSEIVDYIPEVIKRKI
jgi:NAD(P)H-hydrate epimerase